MDSFIYSINATVPIFLVMIIGWFIKQIGLIDDHFANVANRYVFKVALPALLFRDLSKSDFKGKFDPQFVLYCSIVTILMFSLVWIATEIIAIIQNLYGNAGMAPLMIVAAVPLFNIFAVVVLTFKAHPADSSEAVKAGRGNNIKKAFVNILKNPIIIGIVLGFISSMLNMKYPAIINKTIESLAQTATPIALICIGAGFEGRKALKKIKPTIIATFIKLIGLAAVFIPVAVFLGFRNQELVAALIMLASPTTVTSYVMAKSMDNDEVLSSSIIVLTTVLSSITLTGWIFILRALGLI